jgi:hypothetical protein
VTVRQKLPQQPRLSRSALDRNFRSIAAKLQGFSRHALEFFRLAPEKSTALNRKKCRDNTASIGVPHRQSVAPAMPPRAFQNFQAHQTTVS